MGEGRGGASAITLSPCIQQRRGPEPYPGSVSWSTSLDSYHIPKGATTLVPDTAPSANNGGLLHHWASDGGALTTLEGGGS